MFSCLNYTATSSKDTSPLQTWVFNKSCSTAVSCIPRPTEILLKLDQYNTQFSHYWAQWFSPHLKGWSGICTKASLGYISELDIQGPYLKVTFQIRYLSVTNGTSQDDNRRGSFWELCHQDQLQSILSALPMNVLPFQVIRGTFWIQWHP